MVLVFEQSPLNVECIHLSILTATTKMSNKPTFHPLSKQFLTSYDPTVILNCCNMTICLGSFNLRLRLIAGVTQKISRSIDVLSSTNTNLRKMQESLPHYASGEIVPGFGRGSKELGIPTANFSLDVVKALPPEFITGVYYGWANIDNGEVHKMVMSVGWNPFYENKQKSMETHILHEFNRDLYGCLLKVVIVGYLRPEKNFDSLEALVATIKNDIHEANVALDNPDKQHFKDSNFFRETHKTSNNHNGTTDK